MMHKKSRCQNIIQTFVTTNGAAKALNYNTKYSIKTSHTCNKITRNHTENQNMYSKNQKSNRQGMLSNALIVHVNRSQRQEN